MLNSLYKFLLLNNNVSIPGIGSFFIERTAAVVNAGSVIPPKHQVQFQPGTALADRNFYSFLALETGSNEVEAIRKFQDFAYQLRKDIQSHPHVQLSGLGILQKNAVGEIEFQPSISADHYFPVIPLIQPEKVEEKVVDEPMDEHHGIEVYPEDEQPIKKDRWWIWAITLTVIALAAITYYYMQQGVI